LLGACGDGDAEGGEQKRERDESMHLRSGRWGDGRVDGDTPICTAVAAGDRGGARRRQGLPRSALD
jgi:hypothetical protein